MISTQMRGRERAVRWRLYECAVRSGVVIRVRGGSRAGWEHDSCGAGRGDAPLFDWFRALQKVQLNGRTAEISATYHLPKPNPVRSARGWHGNNATDGVWRMGG